MGSSIASALAGRALGRVAAAALQGAALVLVFRTLEASTVGPLFAAFTLASLITGFAVFGLNSVTLRAGSYDAEFGAAALIWSLRSSGLGTLASLPMAVLLGISPWLAAIGALWAYSETASELRVMAWSGEHEFARGNALLIVRRLTFVAALGLGSLLGPSAFLVALATHAAGLIVMVAYPGLRSAPAEWTQLWPEGAKYWGAGVASQLVLLDVTLVRVLFGDEIAGGYAAATRLAMPIATVASSVTSAVVPFLIGSTVRQVLRRTYKVALCSSVLVTTTVPIVLYYIAPLALGNEYQSYTVIAMAAAAAAGISLLSQVLLSSLLAQGRGRAASLGLMVGTTTGLVLIALLGETLGILGLATGLVLLQLAVLVLLVGMASKTGDIRWP